VLQKAQRAKAMEKL